MCSISFVGRPMYIHASFALALLLLLQAAHASYLTGSKFPWEGCKRGYAYQRWTARVSRYKEDAENGSELCFSFGVKPRTSCEAAAAEAKLRCCNDLDLQKLKVFVAPECLDSRTIQRAEVNGELVASVYASNDIQEPYFKITGMEIPFAEISNSTLCITLRGTKTNGKCPTLSQFVNNYTRALDKLEYALYDIKQDQYECCPHFVATLSALYGTAAPSPSLQSPLSPPGSKPPAPIDASPKPPSPLRPAAEPSPSPKPLSVRPPSPGLSKSPASSKPNPKPKPTGWKVIRIGRDGKRQDRH